MNLETMTLGQLFYALEHLREQDRLMAHRTRNVLEPRFTHTDSETQMANARAEWNAQRQVLMDLRNTPIKDLHLLDLQLLDITLPAEKQQVEDDPDPL